MDFQKQHKLLLTKNNKIIHQVWFGTIPNKRKAKKAYESMSIFRKSWDKFNWHRIEWNKKNSRELIKLYFPEFLKTYDSYPYEIQRIDAIRYFILYTYGGLYVDMDYYCNKPWIFDKDIYLVETPNGVIEGEHVSNSMMYSVKSHPFWKFLFIQLELNKTSPYFYPRHFQIMASTGPLILSRTFRKNKLSCRVHILPFRKFHPFGISDDITKLKDNSEIYAIHIGKGSWEGSDSKFFLFLYTEWKILLFIILYQIIIKKIEI